MKIEVKDLKKKYGTVEAIKQISLIVPDGELLAFLGPSGCGKTTLLRMIAGLIPVTEGKILFNGRDVTQTPAQDRNTAMVFQNYALFPNMNVLENVEFGLKVRKFRRKQCREKALCMLERVQLTGYADRRIQELSGGQKQRVALARALVTEPDILLFDEPLSNLDQKLRVSMRQTIRNLQQEFHITSIYVTHDQEEAMSISDKIAVMNEGVLQQLDTPQKLYFEPKNKFVSDFIGKSNLITAVIEERDGKLESVVLGNRIEVPEQYRGKASLTVMIRPENLVVTDQAGLSCTVVFREILGLISRYHIQTENGQSLIVDIMNKNSDLLHSVGDTVFVSFDSGAILFFEE
ncbi:MAG: ABC transporter ATP-binding protein [Clostridiaceae bacterium]|nr:ABC transporter ATP-binding protein [Clostridiaceae bacterium]